MAIHPVSKAMIVAGAVIAVCSYILLLLPVSVGKWGIVLIIASALIPPPKQDEKDASDQKEQEAEKP